MKQIRKIGRRLVRQAAGPHSNRILSLFDAPGLPWNRDSIDRFRQKYTIWRVLDEEYVTTYSSLSMSSPSFLEYAAQSPAALQRKPTLHFLDATWHFHGSKVDWLAPLYQRAKSANPLAKFVVIGQTPFSVYRLWQAGIESILANSAAFEDDLKWAIEEPDQEGIPRFEAIYNARLLDWKNHHLARDLGSLLFIYEHFGDDQNRVHEYRRNFPGACFGNHDLNDGKYKHFDAREMSALYAQADVSLALSQEEGFMRASAQSLLCGKPVVSTPNIGGRSRLYHDDTALFAEPTPEAVKAAVAKMKARQLPADFVRRETLKLFQIERREILESVGALRTQVFGPTARDLGFEPFRGIKFRYQPVIKFLKSLDSITA